MRLFADFYPVAQMLNSDLLIFTLLFYYIVQLLRHGTIIIICATTQRLLYNRNVQGLITDSEKFIGAFFSF